MLSLLQYLNTPSLSSLFDLDSLYHHLRLLVPKSKSLSKWSIEEINHEGLRCIIDESDTQPDNKKRGWLHLRESLHDPIISLTAESDIEGGVNLILEALVASGLFDEAGVRGMIDWESFVQELRR